MKSLLIFILLSVPFCGKLQSQEKYTADVENSNLVWLGERITSQHTGTVNLQSGWLTMKDNMITGGEFIIDMTTIEESNDTQKLEGHLRSDDFFGVDKFPVSKLVVTGSSSFEKGAGVVNGNLTIRDTTNPIEFKAAMQKSDEGYRFFANIVIDRAKYNVRFGSGSFFDNLGDRTIFDEFKLKVSLLVKGS